MLVELCYKVYRHINYDITFLLRVGCSWLMITLMMAFLIIARSVVSEGMLITELLFYSE